MIDFRGLPLPVNLVVLLVSAAIVWGAGTRLARIVDAISERTGLGRAFAGFLLLGGVTSLPELATVITAAHAGHANLALSSILGSVSTNVLLLAFADAVLGRDALTSVVAHPATLLQGTLGILLLGVVSAAIIVGEVDLFGLGLWSASLVPLFGLAVWLTSRYENRPTWIVAEAAPLPGLVPAEPEELRLGLRDLMISGTVAGVVILVAGYLLAETGDAVAVQTGIGENMVGFVLIGLATSLPEISSMVGAVRIHRYELAIGDIFGTNLFDLLLIPVADIVYRHGPILAEAGRFESIALLLGIILTAIYVVGLLDRRNQTILRMGYDSLAAIIVFAGGIVMLAFIG
ncbi:MAG: sodium:calcium antiporter [Bauldia sp.]|uniref:sodium:calcium antiporter n=1 Tax=Bauldia sp. TaxID=2575872 RepID=UPI001DB87FDF|nr:sodium:calcium antiporter [Bauldia sp.]MCB1495743.1 sodium:calcium antiporter [Bauldia sp.]